MANTQAPPVLSVGRTEEKYLLSYPQALALKQKLGLLLHPDTYGGPNGYRVKSLYFDSFRNQDYHEKDAGIFHRKKVRLRIYDEAQLTAKLELKEKHGDLQHKVSVTVTRAQAEALCRGDYSFLPELPSQAALRLYTIMMQGFYRPAAVIEYDRTAFTYPLFSTRITFDSHVRTSEWNHDLYDPALPWDYVLEQQVLLEVKYDRILPGFIKSILAGEDLNRVSVSKYATGRRAVNEWLDL